MFICECCGGQFRTRPSQRRGDHVLCGVACRRRITRAEWVWLPPYGDVVQDVLADRYVVRLQLILIGDAIDWQVFSEAGRYALQVGLADRELGPVRVLGVPAVCRRV